MLRVPNGVSGQKLLAVCDDSGHLVSVNIKIKDCRQLEGTLVYKICTMFLVKEPNANPQSTNALAEANGENPYDQRANRGLAMFEEDVVSQTTSSSCIVSKTKHF